MTKGEKGLKGYRGLKGSRAFSTSLTFLFLLAFTACGYDMSDIERFERTNPPDQEVKDAHVWRSEEGKLQFELDAPTIVQFRQPDTRTVYPEVPPRVEYSLTERGSSLVRVLDRLCDWGLEHRDDQI